MTGDAAFLNPVSDSAKARDICEQEGIPLNQPLFGINVTKYVDGWLAADKQVKDRGAFIDTLANGINGARAALEEPYFPVLFSTHPMDEGLIYELAKKIKAPEVHN